MSLTPHKDTKFDSGSVWSDLYTTKIVLWSTPGPVSAGRCGPARTLSYALVSFIRSIVLSTSWPE